MSAQNEILDKIRKLQAHADSAQAIGSEAEAHAFAAKVQELLTAYKLSQADLGLNQTKVEEPIGLTDLTWDGLGLKARSVRIGWTERLAKLVGDAYYCQFILKLGHHGVIGMLCGAETERQVAVQTFNTLGRFLDQLAEREYVQAFYRARDSGDVSQARGFKAGFMFGFINRLKERFDEELKPSAAPKDVGAADRVNAIVLVRKDAMHRVNKWTAENLRLRSCYSTSMHSGSREGQGAGRAAADRVNLSVRKELR